MKGSSITISGAGAVSAAGWGVPALYEAIEERRLLPSALIQREGRAVSSPVRPVPKPEAPLAFLRNPRLRRCSPISRFAVAAALEALGENRQAEVRQGNYRLGVIFAFMNGCVNYSNRFYGEVLHDPSLASPILFPETVFNAPASHLAAMLESHGPSYTLVGDSAQFLGGVDLGIEWLLDDQVDGVLVVGSEEIDWLSAEAARFFQKDIIVSEGAGALLLESGEPAPGVPVVGGITPAFTYGVGQTGSRAAERLLEAMPLREECAVSLVHRLPGEGIDLAKLLGDSLGAALALQCAHAYACLTDGGKKHLVRVLHVGSNQQAIGAWFHA